MTTQTVRRGAPDQNAPEYLRFQALVQAYQLVIREIVRRMPAVAEARNFGATRMNEGQMRYMLMRTFGHPASPAKRLLLMATLEVMLQEKGFIGSLPETVIWGDEPLGPYFPALRDFAAGVLPEDYAKPEPAVLRWRRSEVSDGTESTQAEPHHIPISPNAGALQLGWER